VLFSTAQAVMASLVKAHCDGSLEDRLAFYAKPKLLIVDLCGAVGYVESRPLTGDSRSSPASATQHN